MIGVINGAIELGRNQIVYIGNPYVWAEKGLTDLIFELQTRVRNPEKIVFVLIHGQGRWILGPNGVQVRSIDIVALQASDAMFGLLQFEKHGTFSITKRLA